LCVAKAAASLGELDPVACYAIVILLRTDTMTISLRTDAIHAAAPPVMPCVADLSGGFQTYQQALW
jgi:hypothetical protein